mmetsp:Transcript_16353/g.34225  ORF Transcript_16353/g.34225 Transcript_16353/m.34225 type:complete len:291 (+) Transcript_16353:1740-2612(+)
MVKFVTWFETTEDTDGVLGRWFTDVDLLKTTFQCLILLDVFPVLVNGSGSNASELSSGERRFEKVRCVHGSGCGSGSYYGVHLINEENNFSITFLHSVHNFLQPLFELSAITRPRNKGPHIQPDQPTLLQRVRHIPHHHPLRDPLRNGRLAHPRIPDQDGIVLRPAAQDLNGPPDLVVAADHGVQLALFGAGGEVDAEFLEGVVVHGGGGRFVGAVGVGGGGEEVGVAKRRTRERIFGDVLASGRRNGGGKRTSTAFAGDEGRRGREEEEGRDAASGDPHGDGSCTLCDC